jgi:uracil-DNA glycosylase
VAARARRLPVDDPAAALARLAEEIRACRHCANPALAHPLPHEPRPVLRVSATARLAVAGQAPGTRVHASGVPFTDPSGERLRDWMQVSKEEFYDETRVAIVPMGFCFPGQDAKGGDLPPRRECAPLWRGRVMAALPQIELILLVGSYAVNWHLRDEARGSLTETVGDWKTFARRRAKPLMLPLPHPSWRNNGWLRANPWFETDLLPFLRKRVRALL